MLDQLIQTGFNEVQAKVYVACLELGKTSIAPLVSRSNVSKKLCYKALKFLIAEGYVVAEGRRKKVFAVTDVELIGQRLQEQLKSFHTILPQLYAAYGTRVSDRAVAVYHDPKSIRNIFKIQMRREKRGGELLAIESARFHFIEFMNEDGTTAFDIYERVRLNRDIQLRVLFMDTIGASEKPEFETRFSRRRREVRMLSSSLGNNLAGLYIWLDRVFLLTQRGQAMSLVELANRDIRHGFAAYFETLWEGGKNV